MRAPVRSQPYSRGWPVPSSPPSDPARRGLLSRRFRPVHKRNDRAVNLPQRDFPNHNKSPARLLPDQEGAGPSGCSACMATPATTARSGRAAPSLGGGERPGLVLRRLPRPCRRAGAAAGGAGGHGRAGWLGSLARRSRYAVTLITDRYPPSGWRRNRTGIRRQAGRRAGSNRFPARVWADPGSRPAIPVPTGSRHTEFPDLDGPCLDRHYANVRA